MVGGLFIGQRDVQAEGAFLPGPFIGRLHDAGTSPRDDHVAVFVGFPGEFPRRFIGRLIVPDARGTEDGYLADVAVRREHAVGAVHLPPGADQDGEIVVGSVRLRHVDARFDIFLQIAGVMPGRGGFRKFFYVPFQGLVAGVHVQGGGALLVFPRKIPVVQKIRMLHWLVCAFALSLCQMTHGKSQKNCRHA